MALTQEVRAALIAGPADLGDWQVPLGLGDRTAGEKGPLYLETLRVGRTERAFRRRRVLIQPEDDVPHIRDRLTRLRDALGLLPVQVAVTTSLIAAAAEVLDTGDLLLCSAAQADELGLGWRPIGEMALARGYDIAAGQHADAKRIRSLPPELIGRCLWE